MISPMRLEGFELRELVVRTEVPDPEGTDEGKLLLSVCHGRNSNENKFHLEARLNIRFQEDASTSFSEIEVALDGRFAFPEDFSDEEIQRFYPVIAMINLLGILRGVLMQSTALFKDGPFSLPLLNLSEFKLKTNGQRGRAAFVPEEFCRQPNWSKVAIQESSCETRNQEVIPA